MFFMLKKSEDQWVTKIHNLYSDKPRVSPAAKHPVVPVETHPNRIVTNIMKAISSERVIPIRLRPGAFLSSGKLI